MAVVLVLKRIEYSRSNDRFRFYKEYEMTVQYVIYSGISIYLIRLKTLFAHIY